MSIFRLACGQWQPRGTEVGYLIVVLAAVVAYAFSAVWYTVLSKRWMAAAGIPMDASGRPLGNRSMMPFLVGFIAQLLVAGMMRHIFVQSGLNTPLLGLMGGLGIGLFLITPWVTMNYAFAGRPYKLSVLDGVIAVVGCTIMGLVFGIAGV
jgi:hypothetical protein